MSEAKTEHNEITEGVIWKQLLIFSVPIMIGTFFQQFYNTVDSIIVGRFVGADALAAVGGTATLINMLVKFFVGLASGATVIIAQYFGARNEDSLKKAVHTGMALSIAGGLLLTVIGWVFAKPALHLINIPDDIFQSSLLYIRIYFLGMVPSLIYNLGAGILRAIGDSKRPQYFLIASCLVNILLDFVFVLGLNLNVAGVAIATVLSQVFSAFLVLYTLTHTTDIYHLNIKEISFDGPTFKEIIRIGLPAGGQSVLYSVSNLIIQSCVNSYGTSSIAAWTAFGKIDALIWLVLESFGIAVTTFVGQNYGAKRFDRVKESVKISLILSGITIGILSLGMTVFAKPLVELFATDIDVITIGANILRQLGPFYISYIFVEIFSGAIKGSGQGLIPVLITCICVCGVRVFWMLVVAPQFDDILMVSICYPITWILTTVVFIFYYLYYSKKTFC